MSLNPLRSITSIVARVAARGSDIASPTCSRNDRRFSKPVSASWFASCERSSAWRVELNTNSVVIPSSGISTTLKSTPITHSGAIDSSAPSAVTRAATPRRSSETNETRRRSDNSIAAWMPLAATIDIPVNTIARPHRHGTVSNTVIEPCTSIAISISPAVDSETAALPTRVTTVIVLVESADRVQCRPDQGDADGGSRRPEQHQPEREHPEWRDAW